MRARVRACSIHARACRRGSVWERGSGRAREGVGGRERVREGEWEGGGERVSEREALGHQQRVDTDRAREMQLTL